MGKTQWKQSEGEEGAKGQGRNQAGKSLSEEQQDIHGRGVSQHSPL